MSVRALSLVEAECTAKFASAFVRRVLSIGIGEKPMPTSFAPPSPPDFPLMRDLYRSLTL